MRRDAVRGQRAEQRLTPGAVGGGDLARGGRVAAPELGDGALQQVADPAGAQPLTAQHPPDGVLVAGRHRQAQIRPVRLRGRADHGPAAGHRQPLRAPDERLVRLVDDAVPVVVLDQQHARVPGQHAAQLGRAGRGEGGAGRVLGAAGDDHRTGARRQRGGERAGQRTLVVQPDGDGFEPEGGQQVEHAAPARVLDGDPVTRAQLGDQDAFDGVERAGGDRERALGHAVGAVGLACQGEQAGVGGRLPVQDGAVVGGGRGDGHGRGQRGQQCGVGVAVGEVPGAGGDGQPDLVARGQRGAGADPAALAAGRLDHPAVAEQAVGSGDGVGVDAELLGELAQRRQG